MKTKKISNHDCIYLAAKLESSSKEIYPWCNQTDCCRSEERCPVCKTTLTGSFPPVKRVCESCKTMECPSCYSRKTIFIYIGKSFQCDECFFGLLDTFKEKESRKKQVEENNSLSDKKYYPQISFCIDCQELTDVSPEGLCRTCDDGRY